MIRLAEASGSSSAQGTSEESFGEMGMKKLDAHQGEKPIGCLVPSRKHL